MKVYNYHPTTGEFQSEGTADPDQLVPDNWILPASSTAEPPPEVGEGNAAVYRDGDWVAVADLRGQPYWTEGRQRRTVDVLGFQLPEGASWDEPEQIPPTAEQIEVLRARAYAHPTTGSDRHFLEAARKRAAGDEEGAEASDALGLERVEQIKQLHN